MSSLVIRDTDVCNPGYAPTNMALSSPIDLTDR
jgi:hypothetical protein